MTSGCPHCACTRADGATVHALLSLLAEDDLDAALELGLMSCMACPGCDHACNASVAAARGARRQALDARDRHRTRAQRLARRKSARDTARLPTPDAALGTAALPPSAADALARALAKAGGTAPR